MTGVFSEWAEHYYDRGYCPLPTTRNDAGGKGGQAIKIRGWQELARNRYDRNTLRELIRSNPDVNVGLGMGQIVTEGLQLIAVDIDSNVLRPHIERALPELMSGKIGSKGATWFFLIDENFKGGKSNNGTGGTAVDWLTNRFQTIVPPSIHPKTGSPYQWLGTPLHELDPRHLPVLDAEVKYEVDEISAGCGQYFIGGEVDGQEFPGLNNMMFFGQGEGGNTHEVRLRAIGHMVAKGWSDEAILRRINRAMREAFERGGVEWNNPPWVDKETADFVKGARDKGYDQDVGKGRKDKVPTERLWAEWLVEEFQDLAVYFGNNLFLYGDGFWQQTDRQILEAKVVRQFRGATKASASRAVDTFMSLVYENEFGHNASDKVCLANGTLEVMTGTLRGHDPDDQMFYKLDVDWDEDSKCPRYEEFVQWMFNGDQSQIDCFEEFAGLTFVDDMSFHKSLWMIGPGGNGKSTLLGILENIHAEEVVNNVSITDLNQERVVTSLVGKLINFSSEESSLKGLADTTFKKIVGGDKVAVRKLYQEVEGNVKLSVRFVLQTNELPATTDSTEAMRRRLMILECPNTVPDHMKDPHLMSKLLTEKSGIMKRWVDALVRLKIRGHFAEPARSRQLVDEHLTNNDAIKLWVRMNVRDPESPADVYEPTILFKTFIGWCELFRYRNTPRYGDFIKRLDSIGLKTTTKRTAVGEMKVYAVKVTDHEGDIGLHAI